MVVSNPSPSAIYKGIIHNKPVLLSTSASTNGYYGLCIFTQFIGVTSHHIIIWYELYRSWIILYKTVLLVVHTN